MPSCTHGLCYTSNFFQIMPYLHVPKMNCQCQTLEVWTNTGNNYVELDFLLVSCGSLLCWLWYLQRPPYVHMFNYLTMSGKQCHLQPLALSSHSALFCNGPWGLGGERALIQMSHLVRIKNNLFSAPWLIGDICVSHHLNILFCSRLFWLLLVFCTSI